jgi:CBS domain containing-hemolysin-like protein
LSEPLSSGFSRFTIQIQKLLFFNIQIPRVGDVIDLPPLKITIVTANDYRVDLVRIVKEQSEHEDDE